MVGISVKRLEKRAAVEIYSKLTAACMEEAVFMGVNVLIYGITANGEKFGFVETSSHLTRDTIVGTLLNSIESDGDIVDRIFLVFGEHTADQLRRMAETAPPKNSLLAYSQKWPYSNRGYCPEEAKEREII